jgi:hypothetical protein
VFGRIGGLRYVEAGCGVGVVGRVLDVEDDCCCGVYLVCVECMNVLAAYALHPRSRRPRACHRRA